MFEIYNNSILLVGLLACNNFYLWQDNERVMYTLPNKRVGRHMRTTGKITNEKILGAARQLIATRGYSNFSYADVSDAIAIHKASIHHHFPTKSSLALAVINLCKDEFIADMAALAADVTDPAAQLHTYIHHWEQHLANDPKAFCVAGMLGAERPFLDEDLASAVGDYFASMAGWLESVLAAGVELGRFQLAEPAKDEAAALVSLVYGAVLVARATGNPTHFMQVTRAAVARLTAAPA
jgi:TetR/AcrR family transcriptional repressor of nem operon